MNNIPNSVMDDIARAVSSAISYGVSAEDFKKWLAYMWQAELQDKAKRDAKTLATV